MREAHVCSSGMDSIKTGRIMNMRPEVSLVICYCFTFSRQGTDLAVGKSRSPYRPRG